MADALQILAAEHKEVTDLLQSLGSTGDPGERRRLADRLVSTLAAHTQLEERIFYPAVAERVEGGQGFVAVSREEHQKTKKPMEKLGTTDPQDPWFSPALGELTKLVKEHVADEEHQLFPRVRRAFSAAELEELGERMGKKRKAAAGR
jgi:hemerythrin superfamily protein